MKGGVRGKSGALGHRPGQSQDNAGCRKHKGKFRACANQPGPPHRCRCGDLGSPGLPAGFLKATPLSFALEPHIFLCPTSPLALFDSHDPQHRQSQMLPVRIPRWPGGFPTVPSCTRARSMLLCRLRSSLQAQPSLDAPLYLPDTH